MDAAVKRTPSRSTNPKEVFVPPISIPSARSFLRTPNLPRLLFHDVFETDRHGRKIIFRHCSVSRDPSNLRIDTAAFLGSREMRESEIHGRFPVLPPMSDPAGS